MSTISDSENQRMKTRSLARLKPNGTTLNISIPENEQPNKINIEDILAKSFQEPLMNETSKILKITQQELQDGNITIDEYNTELKS